MAKTRKVGNGVAMGAVGLARRQPAKKVVRRARRGEWKRGATRDFLEIDEAAVGLVAIRMSLAERVFARRKAARLSQAEVAALSGTTQSRVAKVEKASQEVSLDLCLRVLLSLGASHGKLARAIASAG